jgi:hypothetical protein
VFFPQFLRRGTRNSREIVEGGRLLKTYPFAKTGHFLWFSLEGGRFRIFSSRCHFVSFCNTFPEVQEVSADYAEGAEDRLAEAAAKPAKIAGVVLDDAEDAEEGLAEGHAAIEPGVRGQCPAVAGWRTSIPISATTARNAKRFGSLDGAIQSRPR